MSDATPTGFDPSWLEARHRFDASARDPALRAIAIARLPQDRPARILDLGAGLGASVRHMAPHIPGPQRWRLIDADPASLQRAIPRLSAWALRRGWSCRPTPGGLLIDRPDGALHVEAICGDLHDLAGLTDLGDADLVTANALFDLFSRADLDRLVAALAARRLPTLATINYTGAHLTPDDPDDALIFSHYHAHMRRPRPPSPPAMGTTCAAQLLESFSRAGFRVEQGPSPWRVPPEAKNLLTHLLNFIQGAVPATLHDPDERARFDRWLARRRLHLQRGHLAAHLDHVDLLALPPDR